MDSSDGILNLPSLCPKLLHTNCCWTRQRMHARNPRACEGEAGRTEDQAKPDLYNKFKASLCCIRHCLEHHLCMPVLTHLQPLTKPSQSQITHSVVSIVLCRHKANCDIPYLKLLSRSLFCELRKKILPLYKRHLNPGPGSPSASTSQFPCPSYNHASPFVPFHH